MAEKQTVFLKIYQGGQLKATRQFMESQMSIGSGDGCSVVLDDPSVAHWHALIELKPEGYCVSDLGSPAGTLLNGKSVLEQDLKHGDRIQVGDVTLQFYVGVPFARPSAGGAGGGVAAAVPVREKEIIQPAAGPIQKPAALPVRGKVKKKPPARPVPPVPPVKPPEAGEPALPRSKKPLDPGEKQAFLFEEAKKAGKKVSSKKKSEKPVVGLQTPEDTGVEPLKTEEWIPPEEGMQQQQQQQQQVSSFPEVGKREVKFSSPFPDSPLPSEEVVEGDEDNDGPTVPGAYQQVSPLPQEKEQPAPPEGGGKGTGGATFPDRLVESGVASSPSESLALSRGEEKEGADSLEQQLPLSSSGSVVEVLVTWKNRILSVSHFESKASRKVTFGSDPGADIQLPNMVGTSSYPLLSLGGQAVVHVVGGVKPFLITRKGRYSGRDLREKSLLQNRGSNQELVLGTQQLVRLDFSSAVRVYVRYTGQVQKAACASFLDLNFSEMVGLMMSGVFMSGLMFYLYLLSPVSLSDEEKWEEAHLQKASIEFKKKPRVAKLKMADRPLRKKKAVSLRVKKAKKSKSPGVKKRGKKRGRLGQVASKSKAKTRKKAVTSAKPGGSVKTGKRGGSARSPRPDPTKVGLLGVFGKKGTQTELDKAYSGAGELMGLAEEVTGHAGQKESYAGAGIGTKFKNVGAGGKGTNIIGVSGGIKTRGRGGGTRGYGTGGSLGSRGQAQLNISTDDWEVEGGVDRNAIYRAIMRQQPRMASCYSTILNKNPNLRGRVELKWEIINERARNIQVSSNTTGDRAVARCIIRAVRDIQFRHTGLGRGQIGEVSIPFTLEKH